MVHTLVLGLVSRKDSRIQLIWERVLKICMVGAFSALLALCGENHAQRLIGYQTAFWLLIEPNATDNSLVFSITQARVNVAQYYHYGRLFVGQLSLNSLDECFSIRPEWVMCSL